MITIESGLNADLHRDVEIMLENNRWIKMTTDGSLETLIDVNEMICTLVKRCKGRI